MRRVKPHVRSVQLDGIVGEVEINGRFSPAGLEEPGEYPDVELVAAYGEDDQDVLELLTARQISALEAKALEDYMWDRD